MLHDFFHSRSNRIRQQCHEWFLAHRHRLLGYARQQADCETDVELLLADAVRAAMRQACEGRVQLADMEPYCLRCIRNAAMEQRSRNIRRRELERRYSEENHYPEPSNSPLTHEPEDVHQRLRRELQRLPDELAEIVTLRLWDGLSYAQIARRTGLPETSLRRRYADAIKQLGKSIDTNEPR